MDCPRCGSDNDIGEEFCIYCKWEFFSGWTICSTCNQTVKDGKECSACENRDDWIDDSSDDWRG
jgi:transposase-like protein